MTALQHWRRLLSAMWSWCQTLSALLKIFSAWPMIADLAKQAGFKWSPYKGLVSRETNELVSNDLDNIAKQLIGPNATARDLGSVESILAKMPSAKEIVDRQEADPNSAWNKKKIQTQENEIVNALRRI